MPTESKTPNLNLNSWTGTDKPKRADFVEDNTIIDNVLGLHIANTLIHMSAAEKELLNSTFAVGTLAGDGNSSCTHTLNFSPKFILVFARNKVPIEYNSTNNYYVYNFAIATQNTYGSTSGAALNGTQLTLQQTQTTPSDGIFINLNKYFQQYVYVAFK